VNQLAALLRKGPVLFDGAVGTELMSRGADPSSSVEELNLTSPALVRSVHQSYIAAGADVIETNTFGANRFHLGEHYLESHVRDINMTGARLAVEARNASGRPALVAGSVGSLGRPIEPIGAIKAASAERIYQEQIEALLAGGVDLLLLETYTSLHELQLAVRVAHELAPDLPVIASMSFDEATPEAATALVTALARYRVAAVGANCGSGPQAVLEAARHLVEAGAPAVLAMPNAGLPERVSGRLVYTTGPDYFAGAARQMVQTGARLIGGCCGTRPEHIAAIRRAVDQPRGPATIDRRDRGSALGGAPATGMAPSRLATRLQQGDFVFSVELTPPRSVNPRRMLEGARLLKEAGVDFANVTDLAMARLRMGVMSCAALIQQQVGLEAIAHFTTRDRNVMAIQSELVGAHALGIRNVLCMRGDPPRIGDYPNATAVWDVSAVGLVTILSSLNRGLDANGTPMGDAAQFFVGVAFNPTAEDLGKELRLLKRKLAAGAHFLVTNPVYDLASLERFRDAMPDLEVPVLAGVMPLASARHAAYLSHEVPGIVVPAWASERIEAAGEDAPRAGVEMALELLEGARGLVQGAYVIPAAGRYDLAAQVVLQARELVG
jgi:methionine synthase / methylenetetrahydrofolate reductase(NADPH)